MKKVLSKQFTRSILLASLGLVLQPYATFADEPVYTPSAEEQAKINARKAEVAAEIRAAA